VDWGWYIVSVLVERWGAHLLLWSTPLCLYELSLPERPISEAFAARTIIGDQDWLDFFGLFWGWLRYPLSNCNCCVPFWGTFSEALGPCWRSLLKLRPEVCCNVLRPDSASFCGLFRIRPETYLGLPSVVSSRDFWGKSSLVFWGWLGTKLRFIRTDCSIESNVSAVECSWHNFRFLCDNLTLWQDISETPFLIGDKTLTSYKVWSEAQLGVIFQSY